MLQPSGRWPLRGLSVARPWDRTTATESAGFRGRAFVPKENVRGFGWGWGKGHIQGAWGETGESKTNRLEETHQITFSATGWLHDA